MLYKLKCTFTYLINYIFLCVNICLQFTRKWFSVLLKVFSRYFNLESNLGHDRYLSANLNRHSMAAMFVKILLKLIGDKGKGLIPS